MSASSDTGMPSSVVSSPMSVDDSNHCRVRSRTPPADPRRFEPTPGPPRRSNSSAPSLSCACMRRFPALPPRPRSRPSVVDSGRVASDPGASLPHAPAGPPVDDTRGRGRIKLPGRPAGQNAKALAQPALDTAAASIATAFFLTCRIPPLCPLPPTGLSTPCSLAINGRLTRTGKMATKTNKVGRERRERTSLSLSISLSP